MSRPRQILSRRCGLSSTERRELSLRVMGQSEQGQRLREGLLEKKPLGRWRWLARIAAGEAEGRAAGTERVAKGRCEGANEDGGEGGWHGGGGRQGQAWAYVAQACTREKAMEAFKRVSFTRSVPKRKANRDETGCDSG